MKIQVDEEQGGKKALGVELSPHAAGYKVFQAGLRQCVSCAAALHNHRAIYADDNWQSRLLEVWSQLTFGPAERQLDLLHGANLDTFKFHGCTDSQTVYIALEHADIRLRFAE